VVFAEGVRFPEGQLVTVESLAVQVERTGVISPERQAALRHLIGLWKTDRPPPTDEEVEQIREQSLMEKYGQ